MAYVQRHGIAVEVIPGVSSAIAAPSCVGIPLTKRGVNESFWVITGTCSSGEISEDIRLAAQSSATVVVLMGVSHLQQIIRAFGKTRGLNEPVAIVQSATMPDQKFIYGTVGTIEPLVIANEVASPAVIIIGKVVDECAANEVLIKEKARIASVV